MTTKDIKKELERINYQQNEIYAHIRLHLDEPTKESLIDSFKDFNIVLVAEELGVRKHFHICVGDNDINKFGHKLKKLRDFVKKKFNIKNGNKDYQCTQVRDIESCQRYIMKDHNFLSKGIPQEIVDQLEKTSYKKFTKNKFREELEALRLDFMNDKDFGVREVVLRFMELKMDYNQVLNIPQMENIIFTWMCKRDYEYKHKMADKVAKNIYYKFESY